MAVLLFSMESSKLLGTTGEVQILAKRHETSFLPPQCLANHTLCLVWLQCRCFDAFVSRFAVFESVSDGEGRVGLAKDLGVQVKVTKGWG